MLGTYCSDTQSSTNVHSSSNQMYIKFRNSGFSKGRGFSLTYSTGWYKLNNNKKNIVKCNNSMIFFSRL